MLMVTAMFMTSALLPIMKDPLPSRVLPRMRLLATCLIWLSTALSVACGGSSQSAPLPPKKAKALSGSQVKSDKDRKKEEPEEEHDGPSLPWADEIYSPRPGSSPEPDLELTGEACGIGDAALHEVASVLAELHATVGDAPSLDIANFHLQRAGTPYVMPRLWSADMKNVAPEDLAKQVKDWAQVRPALGEYRCGVGRYEHGDGTVTVTVLQTDVLADIKPIPTKVNSSTWLDLEAAFLTPTSSATVLLLPPEGPPKSLNTKLNQGLAKARFSIETPGTWLVQLMATTAGGPRPVARLLITADKKQPQGPDTRPVPGEEAMDDSLRPADALFAMVNLAREEHGLPLLKRNRTLDRVARDHSEVMSQRGRISHDVGTGDPAHRVEMSGLHPKATGENVASAQNVIRLHRVLWASPSHRENLLLRRWDEMGLSIVEGTGGILFATQLFIDNN